MTTFLTITVLICMTTGQGKSSKTYCYDKGIKNLRSEEIKQHKDTLYYKCSDKEYKSCGEEPYDGCSYKLTNDETFLSSEVCQ
jgi:hypothetical protein